MSLVAGTSPTGLTPVAAMALLTLQLRAASNEAEAAEAEEASLDLASEQAAMRARLDSIVETRRAALERELAIEQAAAEDLVRRGHAVAEQIRSDARARLQVRPSAPSTPAPQVVEVHAPAAEEDGTAPSEAGVPVPPMVEASPGIALDVAPSRGNDAQVVAAIDPEAFARVFAAVLATVLDERFAEWRAAGPSPLLLSQRSSSEARAMPSASIWRGLMHLDILLMMVAAAILMVLLFAWLG